MNREDKINATHIVKCVNSHDELVKALRAITARIAGVWDDKDLIEYGELSLNEMEDVYNFAQLALKKAGEL
jgi:hypothetical protein